MATDKPFHVAFPEVAESPTLRRKAAAIAADAVALGLDPAAALASGGRLVRDAARAGHFAADLAGEEHQDEQESRSDVIAEMAAQRLGKESHE